MDFVEVSIVTVRENGFRIYFKKWLTLKPWLAWKRRHGLYTLRLFVLPFVEEFCKLLVICFVFCTVFLNWMKLDTNVAKFIFLSYSSFSVDNSFSTSNKGQSSLMWSRLNFLSYTLVLFYILISDYYFCAFFIRIIKDF